MTRSGAASGSALRKIPQISALMEREDLADLSRTYSREFVTALVREAVEALRRAVAGGKAGSREVEGFAGSLTLRLQEAIARRFGGHLSPAINATGVIVHTNLGRSPLSRRARERVSVAAGGYCDLEFDLERGARGSRQAHLESLLSQLLPGKTGAAVNNNAAAVLLALDTLARGKEVLISRGELVEIGGSFRIPDVMEKSGAILREVGTTNRTRLGDFETAIGERTGLLMKVHTSNYRIVGFVEEAPVAGMAELARKHGLPFLVDQGSGNLIDLGDVGLGDETPVSELLDQGAHLVTFSGDKLLGGPQAGILCGDPDRIDRIKSNALYRALRPDKMSVAALEATLESFVSGAARQEIPALRMLCAPAAEIKARSEALVSRLKPGGLDLEIREDASRVGGGSAPMHEIPTWVISIRPAGSGAEALAADLRRRPAAVVSRVKDGRVLLDLRTVLEDQEETLLEALEKLAGNGS